MRSSASAATSAEHVQAPLAQTRRAPRVIARVLRDDLGSAPAEWAMVAGLLTLLFLTVLQMGFAMYVRAVAIDAAAEGARVAGLAGADLAAGEARTREVLATALAPEYARDVEARPTTYLGRPAVEVRVTAALPLIGLVGFPGGLEVTGHAPMEAFE